MTGEIWRRRDCIWITSAVPIGFALNRFGSAASKKPTDTAAGYVDHPFADGACCARCARYVAVAQTCRAIAGPIEPDGFCNYYAPADPRSRS